MSSVHTIILMNNGSAYGCGDNKKHELDGTDAKYYKVPTLIATSIDAVKAITCTQYGSWFLTDYGLYRNGLD